MQQKKQDLPNNSTFGTLTFSRLDEHERGTGNASTTITTTTKATAAVEDQEKEIDGTNDTQSCYSPKPDSVLFTDLSLCRDVTSSTSSKRTRARGKANGKRRNTTIRRKILTQTSTSVDELTCLVCEKAFQKVQFLEKHFDRMHSPVQQVSNVFNAKLWRNTCFSLT